MFEKAIRQLLTALGLVSYPATKARLPKPGGLLLCQYQSLLGPSRHQSYVVHPVCACPAQEVFKLPGMVSRGSSDCWCQCLMSVACCSQGHRKHVSHHKQKSQKPSSAESSVALLSRILGGCSGRICVASLGKIEKGSASCISWLNTSTCTDTLFGQL